MSTKEDTKSNYQFNLIEEKIIKFWKENCFPKDKEKKNNFKILMPPPNITGSLHLGHTLNCFLQDVLIRFARLEGKKTTWTPGFDHAGIATEILVKKQIQKEGKNITNQRELMKHLLKWAETKKKNIQNQWEKLGLLINWENLEYTLSPKFKKIVQKTFIHLYNDGLIYQAEKLINFDLKLQTVISDIEVVHKKQIKKLYYVQYWKKDKSKYITVATTRPETIFADQALLIKANSQKWQKWQHQEVINPLTNKLIPVLTSSVVDESFGSGVLKCTPGHDFIDFEVGKKLKLNTVSCFNKQGVLNKLAKEFAGQDRLLARDKIVQKLIKEKKIVKIEQIEKTLPFSSRTNTLVEPILSLQWFLKMKGWAQKMLAKRNEIHFLPDKFQLQFTNWLKKCQDWCISRQLKWGHPLPVYFHPNGETKVSAYQPADKNWKKSSDVLDTWFSSALWSLVNSGWQAKKQPTPSKLVTFEYLTTSYDIIFFWVIKMLFFHYHFEEKIPFQKILIHGLVRDANNEKMSKSKGNVLNPLELIKKFGIDSLRLYLLGDHKIGDDIKFNEQKLIQTNQFCNKLWNINKFIQKNSIKTKNFDINKCQNEFNHYIYQKWFNLITTFKNNFQKHHWSLIIKKIITFIWKDFSNFYLETIKNELSRKDFQQETKQTMNFIWKKTIVLLHPFAPCITEFFWTETKENNSKSILENRIQEDTFITSKKKKLELVEAFLEIKAKVKQATDKKWQNNVEIVIKTKKLHFYQSRQKELNQFLERQKIKIIKVIQSNEEELIINKINFEKKNKDEKLSFLKKELERSKQILNNPEFLKKAKKEVVKKEKEKEKKWIEKISNLIKTRNTNSKKTTKE